MRTLARFLLSALLLAFCAGCKSPYFAPIDLSSPGWHTRTGQAIWKPDKTKPEIVGDLIISSDQSGNAYLQFSKAFPIVTARLSNDGWRVEFPPQNKSYAGPGKPPARIVWLQFLRALNGEEIPIRWKIAERTQTSLTLVEEKRGELLEAHF